MVGYIIRKLGRIDILVSGGSRKAHAESGLAHIISELHILYRTLNSVLIYKEIVVVSFGPHELGIVLSFYHCRLGVQPFGQFHLDRPLERLLRLFSLILAAA